MDMQQLKATIKKSGLSATVGFDAVIDSIVCPVKEIEKGNKIFFSTIGEFGKYLQTKQGLSCMVELVTKQTKIGGNMAILSNALGQLGVQVNCIGSFGIPQTHPIFQSMNANCNLTSISSTGSCTALEFDDGKIMLSQTDALQQINWNSIKQAVGLPNLIKYFSHPNLIGMLNWSEVLHSNDIWLGILSDILEQKSPNKQQIICFDLTDFASKSYEEVIHATKIINRYSKYFKTVMSLNENEAKMLYQILYKNTASNGLKHIGDSIYEIMTIDTLVIHPRDCALGWEQNDFCEVSSFFVNKPKISTGGGDNFNAGFCYAQMLECNLHDSLLIANGVAGYYIREAVSPTVEQLIMFLQRNG